MNQDRSKIAQRAEEPEFRREGYETLTKECTNRVASGPAGRGRQALQESARRAQAGD
jgi:hypothetical protein